MSKKQIIHIASEGLANHNHFLERTQESLERLKNITDYLGNALHQHQAILPHEELSMLNRYRKEVSKLAEGLEVPEPNTLQDEDKKRLLIHVYDFIHTRREEWLAIALLQKKVVSILHKLAANRNLPPELHPILYGHSMAPTQLKKLDLEALVDKFVKYVGPMELLLENFIKHAQKDDTVRARLLPYVTLREDIEQLSKQPPTLGLLRQINIEFYGNKDIASKALLQEDLARSYRAMVKAKRELDEHLQATSKDNHYPGLRESIQSTYESLFPARRVPGTSHPWMDYFAERKNVYDNVIQARLVTIVPEPRVVRNKSLGDELNLASEVSSITKRKFMKAFLSHAKSNFPELEPTMVGFIKKDQEGTAKPVAIHNAAMILKKPVTNLTLGLKEVPGYIQLHKGKITIKEVDAKDERILKLAAAVLTDVYGPKVKFSIERGDELLARKAQRAFQEVTATSDLGSHLQAKAFKR